MTAIESPPVDEPIALPEDRDWPRPWMSPFLKALSLLPVPAAACRNARISRKTAYEWRSHHAAFAAAWDEALALARDNTERLAHQLATTGMPVRRKKTREKVDAQGKVVERVVEEWEDVERSATMFIFWLKAWYPDRYRWADRWEGSGPAGGPIQIENLESLDAQIAKLHKELADRAKGEPVPKE